MSAPLVKICGVRALHHARVAAEAGADMVGLIFAPSRRQVTPAEAREVTAAAYVRRPRFVGVFVDESPDTVGRLAAELRLDLVQLSGQERADDCATLRVPYMKVVHVRDGMDAGDVLHIAGRYRDAAAIVVDAAGSGANRWGGSGLTFDHAVAAEVVRGAGRPILLAGGLRPETVGAAIRLVQPWGVDVSSGVETDGVKDDAKIAAFIAAAKEAASDNVGIELQFTPWPTATVAIRSRVGAAFRRAGLPIVRETTAPGGDASLPDGMTWARTTLNVRFLATSGDEPPGIAERRIFTNNSRKLGQACADVRDALPELPIGLEVITSHYHRRYAFAPDDAPEDVQAGIDALANSCDHHLAHVFGWYRVDRHWAPI